MLAKTNAVHEAWAAAERTLDFKVTVNGTTYTATDITELDFDAGAMNGDALTLGSTYANTVKIIFSHLVEGLALTNEVTPEIGIQLPDGTWDYTALGVFVIDSQVEQDRNNNTTTVSATDRFVMMGGTYTSKLDYPADVLDVATEIADQAGVQINATDIGHLPAAQVPSAIAGATLREAIGFVAQFCAGFATFDRDGQLSIRTLNDPEFTITTNQYQSKGLTKNEVMYQVDGLTCEVEASDDTGSSDTVTLQAGNTTGNQIVLTNPVMTQTALDGLYTQLQDTNFYSFSLDWFGDPSVEVGDWIEIVDAAGNKFKTPNLLFALTFNGSLTATSKADTTVTANSNFSYVNTNNKRIIRDLRARIDASGHKITDGTEAPENPKLGDIWFAKDGPDTIIRIWTLNPDTGEAYWKDEVSTKTTSDIAAQIDEIMKQLKTDEDALADKLAANDAAQTVLNSKLGDNAAAITKVKQDTDSAVADVTTKVNQAADDTAKAVSQAGDAAATATNALTVAQAADSTSTDAKQSAAEAIDTANQAQADAKAAQDGAAGAVTDAKSALDSAGTALTQAGDALKAGQNAQSQAAQVQVNLDKQNGELSASISKVQTGLDGLSVGGRNLLTGTSETLIANETNQWGIAYGGTNANSGITVNRDMSYVFRVWIDKAPFDYHAEVYLWKADRTLSELAVHPILTGNTITAGNSGYSTVVISPSDMAEDVAMLRPDIAANAAHGAASFTVNHCQEKLELGNIPTAWSPAPEDLATVASVHTVETTLTKSLDQLTNAQGQTASDLLTATNKLTTVEDTANKAKSQSSQNASDLLLRVEKADLLSEINLQAGSTLIKTGKLYLDAATVTFSGAAIIPSAAIMSLDATKITTGTLDASKATIINLNADNIVSGSIDTEKVTLKNLSASSIVSGELDASKVTVSNLSASNIIGGTLDANLVTVKDLSASSITSGTLNAGLLNVINLNADSITTGTLSGANLSMNLNTGEVLFTSGAITGTGMNMNLDNGVIDFTQGRFHDDAGTIDLNVDDGYIATSSGDSQMVLSQGQLLLTQKNIFDSYSATPYLQIANNVAGDSLASASIIGRNSVTVCNSANTGSIISMGVETLAGLFAGKATDGWKMTKVGGADRGVIISGGKMSGGALGDYSPSIVVGCDSSGGGKGRDRISIGASYVHIPSAYSRTSSGSANVHVASDGALLRSTSAAKYKTDILRTTSSAIGHKLLGIQTATWIDKADQARYASDPNHYERPSRNFGMIADDLDAAGIPELVTYVDGEIEGINYDRIGPALVPVIRELNDKVNQLEALYNAIKNDKLTA